MPSKANVYIKYLVLVEYKNVDLDEDGVPDLPYPQTTNDLVQSARVDFFGFEPDRDATLILEVEPESEDIYHIEEPDDRPDTMPEGGAY